MAMASLFLAFAGYIILDMYRAGTFSALRGPGCDLIGSPVTEISFFESARINDELLSHLREFPTVERLSFTNVDITDKGLINITALPNLRELSFVSVPICDEGIKIIKPLKQIRALSINQTNVSDKGLEYIQDWIGLEFRREVLAA